MMKFKKLYHVVLVLNLLLDENMVVDIAIDSVRCLAIGCNKSKLS